ncbi:MAG TPA: hypothetical protein VGH65_02900 [Verrucomicrobiaceae bacterium]|jgi:hypothetical protein
MEIGCIEECPMTMLMAENMAALRALPSSGFAQQPDVQLRGYCAAGDGGCGTFSWNESDTQPDNDDTVIKPDDVPEGSPGRLVRLFAGPLEDAWPGAICLRLDLAESDLPEDANIAKARFTERTGFWS